MTSVFTPTLAGYLTFLRGTVGIPTSDLPDNSPDIDTTFEVSLVTVNRALCQVSPRIYQLAVYNLATSLLLNWSPDQSGKTYFADIRAKWNMNDFISGVIQSSGDNGSNESMVVQKAADNFTLDDLQRLKDPFGRQYLQWAQKYGTLWGMT